MFCLFKLGNRILVKIDLLNGRNVSFLDFALTAFYALCFATISFSVAKLMSPYLLLGMLMNV